MSDPRDFDRDPNLSRNRYFDRISDGKSTFGWIVAAVIGVARIFRVSRVYCCPEHAVAATGFATGN